METKESDKIKEFLKTNGYKMTLVAGAFQYWSHLEKPAIWLRTSPKTEIFVQVPLKLELLNVLITNGLEY